MNPAARVIGVIDISDGLAVHAQGGARAHYGPVQALAGTRIRPGDAMSIGRWYVERLGLREMYVADLDALRGRPPQMTLVAELASLGVPVWLDAALSSPELAQAALQQGVSKVVVGLETLPSFEALSAICGAVGRQRVAFSLDLRRGDPVVAATAAHGGLTPEVLTAHAVEAGAETVIVLDLARVGMRRGIDLDLLRRVRAHAPQATLVVGGGVRGVSDLLAAGKAGCDAALVATALYDGRLDLRDLPATV